MRSQLTLSTRPWPSSCRDQTTTALTISLGLPAELRLKILRYLFKRKELIYSRKDFQEHCWQRGESCADNLIPQLYKSQGALSSQLLSTCQQLYLEGRDVLYRENTLCVYYGLEPGRRVRLEPCYILDSSATVPRNLFAIEDVSSSLLDYADKPDKRGGTRWLHDAQPLTQAYPAISFLQKIHLTLNPRRDDGAWVAGRVFRELLSGKDVTVITNEPMDQDTLVALKILRCRSFNLILQIPALDGVARMDIEQVITSQAPVQDRLCAWWMLETNVLDKLPRTPGPVLEWSKLLSDLRDAAWHYDGDRYEELADRVLQQVDLENEQHAQQQIAVIHNARDEMREVVKKHRSSTATKTHLTSETAAEW